MLNVSEVVACGGQGSAEGVEVEGRRVGGSAAEGGGWPRQDLAETTACYGRIHVVQEAADRGEAEKAERQQAELAN